MVLVEWPLSVSSQSELGSYRISVRKLNDMNYCVMKDPTMKNI